MYPYSQEICKLNVYKFSDQIQQLGHKEEQDRNCLKHKENGQEWIRLTSVCRQGIERWVIQCDIVKKPVDNSCQELGMQGAEFETMSNKTQGIESN